MSTLTPAELIRQHFDAKQTRDKDALRSQMAVDIRQWAPQSAVSKGIVESPIVGVDRVLEHMTDEMYADDGREWTILSLLADGDQVAVRARLIAKIANSGADYDNTYAFLFRVENNKIADVWVDFDTAYAFEKFSA